MEDVLSCTNGLIIRRNLWFAWTTNQFPYMAKCRREGGPSGVAAKRDSEYKRKGTANVFCAVEPGRDGTLRFPRLAVRTEFAKVIAGIARRYPLARTIHLVVDNLNIHCWKSLTNHLTAPNSAHNCGIASPFITRPSMAVGSTRPNSKSDSFARQCLGKRRVPDLATLSRQKRKLGTVRSIASER